MSPTWLLRPPLVRLVAVVALLATAAGCGSGPDPVARAALPTTTSTTTPPVPAPPEPVPEVAPPPPPPAAPVVAALPGDEGTARVARPAAAPRGGQLQVTGRIEIPRIGLSHTTYEGISLSVIDHGPSHWPGTAMPGEGGNTVFAGHRVTHSRPFFDIDRLGPGDEVIFSNGSGRFVYEVTQTLVVSPGDTWIANPTPGRTFTIFACHPKGSARQRLVVRGNLRSAGAAPGGAPGAAPGPAPGSPSGPPATTTTTAPRPACLLCLK